MLAHYKNNLLASLLQLGKPEEAIEAAKNLPGEMDAKSHELLATAYIESGEYEKAVAAPIEGINGFLMRSWAYDGLGSPWQSEMATRTGLSFFPDSEHLGIELAINCFRQWKWKEAFELWEKHRFKVWPGAIGTEMRKFPELAWNGEKIYGKLLVTMEQGLGDNILFARFATEARKRVGELHVQSRPEFAAILEESGLFDAVHVTQMPKYEAHCSMLSLPGIMKLDYVPNGPYLKHAGRVDLPSEGLNVGVYWGGNPSFHGDMERSMPLKFAAPLAAIPGVRLFNLTKETAPRMYSKNPTPVDYFAHDFPIELPELRTWEDTASLLNSLDLVVTTCTGTANLAGAMGIPAIVLLSKRCCWRWGYGETSPWYPSMQLVRQKKLNEWKSCIDDIAPFIASLAAKKGKPVSSVKPSPPADQELLQFASWYDRKNWIGSGFGSAPEFTEKYRAFLEGFIRQHGIKSVLDVGCGDWQFSKLIDWKGLGVQVYHGVDVVETLIVRNKTLYEKDGITFSTLKYDLSDFPEGRFDLVICKDVVQHLPIAVANRLIDKMTNAGRKLLLSNDHGVDNEIDIQPGSWVARDYTAAPFNLAGEFVFDFNDRLNKRTLFVNLGD